MKKQLLSNKQIPIDIRRRLYQATVVNIALWGCESWALKEADRSKLEAFHHDCLRRMCGWTMWEVAEKRVTNEQVRRTVANSPTMDSMAFQTQRNEGVKISEANARLMVSKATTSRETSADHTTRIHQHPQETGLWRRERATS
jgi:hypothetical protein